MKNRIPRYPGRIRLTPIDAANGIYDLTRADDPEEVGTPLAKKLLDFAVAACGVTAGTSTAYTLDGELVDGFTLTDGAKVNFKLHTASGANATLREKCGEDFPCDRFVHEQSLLIREGGKIALFAGCAHTGVVNIIEHAKTLAPRLDAVFAGFHLHNPTLDETQPRELVDAVAQRLASYEGVRYYTGHCTGKTAFSWMQETLGERLYYMSGGTEFLI